MPELRKDYITDCWVVISTERAQRPSDFRREPEIPTSKDTCPFCPGREHMTPPEVLAYRPGNTAPNTPQWWLRVVPNKFPALRIEGDVNHRIVQVFNRMNGVGAHEVIIESPDHDATIATMPLKQVEEIVNSYKDRYLDLKKDTRFKYMLIFKNHGRGSGASLSHPHSQLIATPMIPKHIMEELRDAYNYYSFTGGTCIYDEIVSTEMEEKVRIVLENEYFITLSPFAPRFPFELWILPKRHDPYFEDMDDTERRYFASILQETLVRYYRLLDNPPYNFYIHTAPCDGKDYRFYHWHLEITPRLTNPAGFERGTGFYINPMPPEEAARFLREGK
ncbi:MAG: galactose-1-phosphate uridylyltransferase [Thermoplasmata archaeon]